MKLVITENAQSGRRCQDGNCPGQADDRPARLAAPGLRLCDACGAKALACLAALPGLYADCETALARRPRPGLGRTGPRRRTTALPIDEAAANARSAILTVLACWSALVADERAVTRPARRQAGELAAFLGRHADWLLAHPAAGEFAAEIGAVTKAARQAVHPRNEQRVLLGQCPHRGCAEAVFATRVSGEPSGSRDVRCDADHSWPPHQWLLLSRQLGLPRGTGADDRNGGAEQ
jgi:hypothetical protein